MHTNIETEYVYLSCYGYPLYSYASQRLPVWWNYHGARLWFVLIQVYTTGLVNMPFSPNTQWYCHFTSATTLTIHLVSGYITQIQL